MIAVQGVTKRFGPLVAVNDVSFEVDRGEVVGFLGPNAAGKTTTMRMLTGTLQPDSGVVQFDGVPIETDLREAKRRVGYLPEANPLYDDMLVAEYLEYVAEIRRIRGANARRAVRDAVEETALDAVFFRPIGECSKGYRQRIGLAAAILHRPEILVLDEPTEGLDPNQRVEIRKLINALGAERTVLLSTHVMQEVEATCQRLLIISGGRLVADGTVADLAADRTGGAFYLVEAEGEGVSEALAGLEGVSSATAEMRDGRTRVRLEVASGAELRPTIFQLATHRGWALWELYREQANLERVFRSLTANGEADRDDVGDGAGDAAASEAGATAPAAADDASAAMAEEVEE